MEGLVGVIQYFYERWILRDVLGYVTPGAILVTTVAVQLAGWDSLLKTLKNLPLLAYLPLFGLFFIVGFALIFSFAFTLAFQFVQLPVLNDTWKAWTPAVLVTLLLVLLGWGLLRGQRRQGQYQTEWEDISLEKADKREKAA